jgi:two-component system sensor histidine kinase KdpD
MFERRSAAAVVEAETERLRSTLLSGISHDFRSPLTTIVGAATSLLQQDKALDAARRTTLTRSILGEAERMHALVSDLLDLTRMEEGAVQPSCEWCPADELIEEARDALGPRLCGHALRVDIPAEAVVWCDPRLLEQVLVNLLDNALRHTPEGSTIDVSVQVDDARWRLVVADNGPGLPAGQERDVFKKFFRGRDEPAGAGTGLGLAICAAVARLHRGTIEAATGGGARFTLTLPQPLPQASPLEEAI